MSKFVTAGNECPGITSLSRFALEERAWRNALRHVPADVLAS